MTELARDLQGYLQESRDSVMRAIDGLSDYDARRPLTPSGSNLLGLVKHLTGVELGYLGECVGRPASFTLPWYDDGSVWEGADMWLRPDESRDYIVGLYHQAWANSDESIAMLPLDAPATVSWWSEGKRETTFGHLLARMVAETAHHAGHCDILREGVDGQGGTDHDAIGDSATWSEYVATIQAAAEPFRP